ELGPRADEKVLRSCPRLDLRLAMLQYPLRYGPTEELVWFMAETDALRRGAAGGAAPRPRRGGRGGGPRADAPPPRGGGVGGRARGGGGPPPSAPGALQSKLGELLEGLGEGQMGGGGEDVGEASPPQALGGVCCAGVAGVRDFVPAPPPPVRHRDLLLQ